MGGQIESGPWAYRVTPHPSRGGETHPAPVCAYAEAGAGAEVSLGPSTRKERWKPAAAHRPLAFSEVDPYGVWTARARARAAEGRSPPSRVPPPHMVRPLCPGSASTLFSYSKVERVSFFWPPSLFLPLSPIPAIFCLFPLFLSRRFVVGRFLFLNLTFLLGSCQFCLTSPSLFFYFVLYWGHIARHFSSQFVHCNHSPMSTHRQERKRRKKVER